MAGSSSSAYSYPGTASSSDESLAEEAETSVKDDLPSTPATRTRRTRDTGSGSGRTRRRRDDQDDSLLGQDIEMRDTEPDLGARRRSTVVLNYISDSSDARPPDADDGTIEVTRQYALSPYVPTDPTSNMSRPRQTARRSGTASRRFHGRTSESRTTTGESLARRSKLPGPQASSTPSKRMISSRDGPATTESFMKPQAFPTIADLSFAVPVSHSQFPTFRGCARYDGFFKQHEPQQFFDCKFYPYTEPGVDPVFAVVGGSKVILARPTAKKELMDVIMWLDEELVSPSSEAMGIDSTVEGKTRRGGKKTGSSKASSNAMPPKQMEPVELNSCVWLRDAQSMTPYLAVSGKPSSIKIIDVTNKRLHRTFVGHGKEVNDLAVSPRNSSILASASGDHTVRLWSIDPKYAEQPCVAMCAGEGHRQALLTVAFHTTSRYLLTGGVDCAVCLWVLPELPDVRSGSDKPTVIHYPHFMTTAIHMSFVDCVAFHNDLILSKSAMENKIVMWRIEGFDSSKAPPAKGLSNSRSVTNSAFGGKYQRLIQFSVADTYSFYIRFSVFSLPQQRAVLAIGNEKSKVLFWDLEALVDYVNSQQQKPVEVPLVVSALSQPPFSSIRGGRPRKKGRSRRIGGAGGGSAPGTDWRQDSVPSEASSAKQDSVQGPGVSADSLGVTGAGKQRMESRYRMNDPFETLEPHKLSTVQKVSFACRQVAWSVGGEHLVVVGDQGMIALFSRDLYWPDDMET